MYLFYIEPKMKFEIDIKFIQIYHTSTYVTRNLDKNDNSKKKLNLSQS